jgi:hypothetical protein
MADLVADRASNRTLCVQLSQDGMRFFCDGSMDCRLSSTAIFWIFIILGDNCWKGADYYTQGRVIQLHHWAERQW